MDIAGLTVDEIHFTGAGASGKKLIVHVTVYALVRGAGHRTKSFNLPVTVC